MLVKTGYLPLALLIAGVVSVPSCREPSAPPELSLAAGPQASLVSTLDHTATKRASNTVNNMGNGLPKCDPLPTATSTATIGPSGGVLDVGPHTLSVPAGALRQPVTITAVAPSDTVDRIQFQPEGLVFRKPAALTMDYANCNLIGSAELSIAYTDDALVILEYVSSVDKGKKVVGQLEHFSNYAIAW